MQRPRTVLPWVPSLSGITQCHNLGALPECRLCLQVPEGCMGCCVATAPGQWGQERRCGRGWGLSQGGHPQCCGVKGPWEGVGDRRSLFVVVAGVGCRLRGAGNLRRLVHAATLRRYRSRLFALADFLFSCAAVGQPCYLGGRVHACGMRPCGVLRWNVPLRHR
jgi:hypothetical protein